MFQIRPNFPNYPEFSDARTVKCYRCYTPQVVAVCHHCGRYVCQNLSL